MMLEIMIKVLLEFLSMTFLPPNKMLKDACCLSSQEGLRPLGCAIEASQLSLQPQLAKWPFLREGKEGKHKMFRGPLSESDSAVSTGLVVPALQSGIMLLFEVFKLAVSSSKSNDWSLFGGDAA